MWPFCTDPIDSERCRPSDKCDADCDWMEAPCRQQFPIERLSKGVVINYGEDGGLQNGRGEGGQLNFTPIKKKRGGGRTVF